MKYPTLEKLRLLIVNGDNYKLNIDKFFANSSYEELRELEDSSTWDGRSDPNIDDVEAFLVKKVPMRENKSSQR